MKSYEALGVGIAAISFGAIFARLASGPATLVAALRMAFAVLMLLPLALASRRARRELAGLSKRDARLLVLAGSLLALHFILWISSLSFTGVTSSVVFVTTNPLWVALGAMVFLGERVSKTFWLGLGFAIAGGIVVGGGDLAAGGARWRGDLLALGGAAAIAGYFLVGSGLRKRLSLIGYVFPVYACAAAILSVAAFVSGEAFAGHGRETYAYSFLMALVCQLLGHSLFNFALKRLAAAVVAIAAIGEPVGASVLALFILGERPGVGEVAGGAMILAGIFLVLSFNPAPADGGEGIVSGS